VKSQLLQWKARVIAGKIFSLLKDLMRDNFGCRQNSIIVNEIHLRKKENMAGIMKSYFVMTNLAILMS